MIQDSINEISKIPTVMDKLQAQGQKLTPASAQDPNVAYSLFKQVLNMLSKNIKKTVLAVIHKDIPLFKKLMYTIIYNEEMFISVIVYWANQFHQKNPDGNYIRKTNDLLNTLKQIINTLDKTCDQLSEEEKDIIGAKKNISIMNDLLNSASSQLDELFDKSNSSSNDEINMRTQTL